MHHHVHKNGETIVNIMYVQLLPRLKTVLLLSADDDDVLFVSINLNAQGMCVCVCGGGGGGRIERKS